jgi:hypothetical protein
MSTSNCGVAALSLFAFGPVCDDGFGLGYIIRENSININITSFMVRFAFFCFVVVCVCLCSE